MVYNMLLSLDKCKDRKNSKDLDFSNILKDIETENHPQEAEFEQNMSNLSNEVKNVVVCLTI